MAQFYTLEEAARHLGMSPEDLKQKYLTAFDIDPILHTAPSGRKWILYAD